MLEYLTTRFYRYPGHVLHTPILASYHNDSAAGEDWAYFLVKGRLHHMFDDEYGFETHIDFACPPDPIALSHSSEGLLLLTRQGYFRFREGQWVTTHQATVAQFYNYKGVLIYPEPAIADRDFRYPPR